MSKEVAEESASCRGSSLGGLTNGSEQFIRLNPSESECSIFVRAARANWRDRSLGVVSVLAELVLGAPKLGFAGGVSGPPAEDWEARAGASQRNAPTRGAKKL